MYSVALVVDNPEIYNKMSPRLKGYDKLKFVIVLWPSKNTVADDISNNDNNSSTHLPIYTYDEMLLSGRTSRQALAAVTSSGITILLNLLSLSLSVSLCAYVLGLQQTLWHQV
jgi:long-chain acyl-CoA synthetase